MTNGIRARNRRKVDAGFVALSGWLPAADAAKVARLVEQYRDEVEAVAGQDRPRGRPRKPARREILAEVVE